MKIELSYNCNNRAILQFYSFTKKRALKSMIFSFLKIYKIFKGSFEIPLNGYIWLALVKLGSLISMEAENNNFYVKYVFWKIFQKLYYTIKESISSKVTDLFYSKSTQTILEGHLKAFEQSIINYSIYLSIFTCSRIKKQKF